MEKMKRQRSGLMPRKSPSSILKREVPFHLELTLMGILLPKMMLKTTIAWELMFSALLAMPTHMYITL